MPFGAMMTKATSSRPTISRFTAEEMVTVTICWTEPSSTAPISGPAQLVVPPIRGMAMLLTVLAVNLMGDWLRDHLDPKLRQAGGRAEVLEAPADAPLGHAAGEAGAQP